MARDMLNDATWLNSVSLLSLKDGLVLIGYGPYQKYTNLETIDPEKPVFFVQDFFLSSNDAWLQHEYSEELSAKELKQHLKTFPQQQIDWQTHDQATFETAFSQLQSLFTEKKLEKAVPYIFTFTSELMTLNQLSNSLYQALDFLQDYPGYLYGHWSNNQGFLGLTPETLFEYQANQHIIKTMALAGTKKVENSHEFINNQKELREHQLVIEGLKESLASTGKIHIGETSILKLPKLCHLYTPIEIECQGAFDFEAIVRCMHPTPALGAFPKEAGKKWLADYQAKINRRSYGAPFGVYLIEKGYALCLVGIRQVQWDENGMRIGAGCGIIKESLLEKEWQEIALKTASIRKLLAL